MKKILILLLLILTMTGVYACDSTTTAITTTPVSIPSDNHQAAVDETIYVNANVLGDTESLIVVSRIKNAEPGYYTEYGNFLSAQNLTGSESILVESDRLEIPVAKACNDFYYRSLLSSGYELPFILSFEYKKDGVIIDPISEVEGSGVYDIQITVESNQFAKAGFVNQYMSYLQIAINADNTTFPVVSGGSVVLAGGVYTAAFMTLPGTSGLYTITVETTSFSIDSIQASFTHFEPSILGDQLAGFGESMQTLITGLQTLRDGQIAMKSGVSDINTAIMALSSGSSDLAAGLDEIVSGLSQMSDSAQTLASNLSALSQAANQLAISGSALMDAYGNMMITIEDVVTTFSALHSDDEALLTKLLTLSQTASAIEAAFDTYVDGVGSCAENLALLSTGLNQLAASLEAITTALTSLSDGAGNISDGITAITAAMANLPDSLQTMIDAQTVIIENLQTSLGDMQFLFEQPEALVSFTSDANLSPDSIQFVYTIPAF